MWNNLLISAEAVETCLLLSMTLDTSFSAIKEGAEELLTIPDIHESISYTRYIHTLTAGASVVGSHSLFAMVRIVIQEVIQ
jgi:hypothetical protein